MIMKEIKTKFKTCLEDETLQREVVCFKGEDGKKLGEVTLRQLRRSEILELEGRPPEEYLLKTIESWTFLDGNGKPLELNLENLKSLTSSKKVGEKYALGILDYLFQIATEMNIVTESAEKNSAKQ